MEISWIQKLQDIKPQARYHQDPNRNALHTLQHIFTLCYGVASYAFKAMENLKEKFAEAEVEVELLSKLVEGESVRFPPRTTHNPINPSSPPTPLPLHNNFDNHFAPNNNSSN